VPKHFKYNYAFFNISCVICHRWYSWAIHWLATSVRVWWISTWSKLFVSWRLCR